MERANYERDWYDVYRDDNGELMVHYLGYSYWGEDNGDGPGRELEVCGYHVPIEEFVRSVESGCLMDDICPYNQYIGDMTEAEFDELIDGDNTTRLQFWELPGLVAKGELEPGSYHSVSLELESANVLDTVLEDDSTATGGTAFMGETVADFLLSCDVMPETVMELNEALGECGMKPVEPNYSWAR